MPRLLFLTLLLVFATVWASTVTAQPDPLDQLERWLEQTDRASIDRLKWATEPLSREQAEKARDLLWDDYVKSIRSQRESEWSDKVIELDDLKMKFEFKRFGEADKDGRRLFISMHGGGGAPARVNEQQWQNQIRLYEPEEGIYLAPRAPTDTWNLWHQGHIDRFFERIIQDAVIFENVDPNRVYLMGYSAGGDGVYQLAPRMADHLAAAAMMAGHPNDASPLGLRNIGFTLHMGGEDSAYNRNGVAREWKQKLADLQQEDPEGYQHEVVIHEGKGHWMDREDAVAVEWMSKFERNPYPTKVVWQVRNADQRQFYWLASKAPNGGDVFVARLDGQVVSFDKKPNPVCVRFNDEMINLDKPVTLNFGDGEQSQVEPRRTIATLYETLQERGDRNFMFSAEVAIE